MTKIVIRQGEGEIIFDFPLKTTAANDQLIEAYGHSIVQFGLNKKERRQAYKEACQLLKKTLGI